MTLIERSEMLCALFKLRSDAAALFIKAQDCGCVSVGMTAEQIRDLANDKLDEMQGRETLPRPVQLNFSRSKF